MRLTIALLGFTFDASLEPTAADEDRSRDLSGGTTASTPIGFVAAHDVPADLPWVERDNGWGDEDQRGEP